MTEDELQKKSLNLLKVSNNNEYKGGTTMSSQNFTDYNTNFEQTKTSYMEPKEANKFIKKIKKEKEGRVKKLEQIKEKIREEAEHKLKESQENSLKIQQQKKEEKLKQIEEFSHKVTHSSADQLISI